MKVWIKTQIVIQENREELVVGACDENLLGFQFEQFKVSEQFFKGDLVELEKAVAIVKKATIANVVGEKIVNALLKENIIKKEGIKKIGKIPHAQIYKI